jgi:hypothetical protein
MTIKTLWEQIQKSSTKTPTRLKIPNTRSDHRQTTPTQPFQPNQQYFQIRINELYLSTSRKWFSEYDPLVFAATEFIYDKKAETVPFVVGLSLIEKNGQKAPTGGSTIFSNTRVAGLHPYRGGRLTLSIVLYRVKRKDYAQGLLKLIESVSSAIDFSTALRSYTKVAGVLLTGIETLFGLGDTEPIIAIRKEFDPSAGDNLEPSYFVLIDKPESELKTEQLWVRDNQLVYGANLAEAKPFQEADFVLYSIVQTSDRNDITTLPFYPLYERAIEAALQGDDKSWERAKANLLSLHQTLALSPDLTPSQAKQIFASFFEDTKEKYNAAKELNSLGADRIDIEGILQDTRMKYEQAQELSSWGGGELDLGSFDDEVSIQDSFNKAVEILNLESQNI